MPSLGQALRVLRTTPVVTAVAVVSLALGIGSNAAIFSLFRQILLRPLPVTQPEQLVNLEAPGPKPGYDSCNMAGGCDEVFSYPMFRDLQREQTAFTDIVAHRAFGANLAHRNRTISGEGVGVSGAYFSTLGLTPEVGRLLGPEIDLPIDTHRVAVLSYDFWQNDLGGGTDLLDDTLIVNGEAFTIVGVTAEGFHGTTLGVRPAVFVPITLTMVPNDAGAFDNRRAYWVYLFARRLDSVSLTAAVASLTPLYRSLLSEVEAPLQTNMSEPTLKRFLSKPVLAVDGRRGQSALDDEAAAPLLLLLAVTGTVVLIACANVANLLLARAAARESEMAVRLAIGASRRQVLIQLLTESCLLAAIAGAAGLLVARWTLVGIGMFLPPESVEVIQLTLDPGVVVFTLGLALATGLLFGLMPAVQCARADLLSTLKDLTGQPGGAAGTIRFRAVLVVGQVALSMTLLVMAGLFLQSLRQVIEIDLGIRTDDVVTFRLAPALNGYDTPATRALYDRVTATLAAQPGVQAVTAASVAVFAGNSWGNDVVVEGFEAGPDTDRTSRLNRVDTHYFRTLEIPLLSGRDFSASDVVDTPRVVIVNEAFARKFDLGRDAVGRRMARGGLEPELDMEIVGLVANTRYNDVKNPEPPLFYVPYRQEDEVGSLSFYARTRVAPDGLLRGIPALVGDLDPTLPVTELKTLSQQVRENIFLDRMMATLFAAFAGLATLLAVVGLYGVLAYTVAQRTRELGLRMALGADPARVRNLVLRQVAGMTLVGGLFGLAAAVALGRAARSLLHEIDHVPVTVVGLAGLGLVVVALGAGLLPAYRAARIDPLVALRFR